MYRLVLIGNRFVAIEEKSFSKTHFPYTTAVTKSDEELWKKCSEEDLVAWKEFTRTGAVGSAQLRQPILESWERCRKAEVDPGPGRSWDLLSEKDPERKKTRLIEIARPIIDTLYECIRGSESVIVLINQEGYILKTVGDLSALTAAEKLNFGPGANWNEQSVGTNAIGTALAVGSAIQVTGSEHYCESHHVWTCSAAPIRDMSGMVIGCLDMSGPRENAHPHTLGMVVNAVRAIENHLLTEESHENLVKAHRYMATVFNSVSEGLITINDEGTVTDINSAAARLFNLQPGEMLGKRAGAVLRSNRKVTESLATGKEYSEEEVELNTSAGPVRCVTSAKSVVNEYGIKDGCVVTLRKCRPMWPVQKSTFKHSARFTFSDVIGESRPIHGAREKAKKAAKSPSTILLLGETGTGKEVFAQAIHNASDRKQGPFIAVNCGAIPRELIHSELFGYSEGAFTGARRGGQPGKFELADGGTILLDEIGDMPMTMQTNLLRVLEDRIVVRVGGDKPIHVDVRVIAATSRDLEEEVEKGDFRKDLYYRLNVFSIPLPPLRECKKDLPLLAGHFVERLSRKLGKDIKNIDQAVFSIISGYSWPGNVRELRNVLEQAVSLADGEELLAEHLPTHLEQEESLVSEVDDEGVISLKALEKMAIERALSSCGGNVTKAARALGIRRSTLYEKMKKYGIS